MSAVEQIDSRALTAHPAAAKAPDPHPALVRELEAQITADGLICPVVLLDGQILEGRIRHQACLAAGVAPEYRQFGDAADDPTDDPVRWAREHCDRLLSPDEVAALDQAQTVIDRGLAAFVDVGQALASVRDRRLYRQTHPSFDAWCLERLDMVRRHADRIIQASTVVQLLQQDEDLPAPHVESVARELAALRETPDALRAAWREAIAEHGPRPTAQQTRAHVERHAPAPKKPARPRAARTAAGAAPAAAEPLAAAAAPPAGAGEDDAEPATPAGRSVPLASTLSDSTTIVRQGAYAPRVPAAREPRPSDPASHTGPTTPTATGDMPKMRQTHAVRDDDASAQRARALITLLRDTPPADPRDVAEKLRSMGAPGAIAYLTALATQL